MSEWQPFTWGDVATLEYGKSLRDYKTASGNVPVYGTNGPIGFTDKALCNQPGVVIGRKGAYRGVHYSDRPFFVIDTAFYLKPKGGIELDTLFSYYQLLTKNISSMDSGSAIPSTSREDFYNLDLNLPPIEEQEAIAKILSSLDEKIELNRKQSRTLEAIAQALFKRWFVEFEFPDENGRPYKSSGGAMQPSEQGEIPVGWDVKKTGDILDIRDGTHDSPKQCDQGYPLITSKHIVSGVLAIDDAYLISPSDYEQVNRRSKVDQWDILISMIGTVGVPYFVMQEKVNFAIKNIGLFKTSGSPDLAVFIYLWLISPLAQQDVRSRIAGTTQGYISLGVLRTLDVIFPPLEVIGAFSQMAEPLLRKNFANTTKNVVLAKLRDTLLPKLMSGELRVGDVELDQKVAV